MCVVGEVLQTQGRTGASVSWNVWGNVKRQNPLLLCDVTNSCTPSKDKLLLKSGGRTLLEASLGVHGPVPHRNERGSEEGESTSIVGVVIGFVVEESISIVSSRTENFHQG